MHPPRKENGPVVGAALRTEDAVKVAHPGEVIKEFAARHSVTPRTVWRWLSKDRLVISRTPGGRVRIHGARP